MPPPTPSTPSTPPASPATSATNSTFASTLSQDGKAQTLVEPHIKNSQAALPTSQDMFLSPRVMDAGTFARYSEMLKSIITQATTQGRSLEDFSTDAEEMIRRATETGSTLDKRLQAGVRMLRMIDERVDRTDEALDKVRQALPSADTMRRSAEALMNEVLDNAQSQLDGMVKDAEIRAQAAEHRARIAMQQADDQTHKLNTLSDQLQTRMTELEQRVNDSQTQSGQTIGLLDRRLVSFQEKLNEQIDTVVEKANHTTNLIEQRVENASELTEQRVQSLNESIEPVKAAAEKAMRALGIDPENPRFEDSPLAKIESLVERGESHIAGVDRLLRQLEELQNQAQGVKGEFGMWLIDSATKLDELEARKDLLDGPIKDAAIRIAEIGPDLEDKLELASSKLQHLSTQSTTLKDSINASATLANKANDRLTNQTSQLQALLDGSLHRLTQRVEQAGVWLGSLITRAEQVSGTLGPSPLHTNNQTTDQANDQANDQISHQALQNIESVQSKIDMLTNPPITPSPTTPPTPQPTSHQKIPDRLPIDSISFDGSSVVIKHDTNSNTGPHTGPQGAA